MTISPASTPPGNYPAVDLAQQAYQQPRPSGQPQHQQPTVPQNTFAVQDQPLGKGAMPFARNAKGKPVDSEGNMIKRIMPTDQPLQFWYQRKGFNDFLYLQGGPAGPIAYYVDVKALFAGWSIYLRRGPTRQSPPVLHLTKGVCLIWDKGTQVKVEATEAQPWMVVTNMLRKYEFINKYTFAFNGRQYTWEWTELLGGTHYCKDDDTHEVVCIARLRFTLAWQVISAWGLRFVEESVAGDSICSRKQLEV
ncbi:hypothetical protein WJX74_010023 [Apatococcus lobatus]|uniref:Uncharacterized protein n=1 Tax=Apatococcus lobatus TaxID=904363 RepID=A0AAW1Q2S1_9CHLO